MKYYIFLLCVLLSTAMYAQSNAQRKAAFNTNAEYVVNEGYDPISYFNGKPLKGSKELSFEYKGVTYWFATEVNRTKFKANPSGYEPQYGGWCAYALGVEPQKVKVNPETYKIVDGKLYLFYNFGFTNTLKSWNKAERDLLPKANKNWQVILK